MSKLHAALCWLAVAGPAWAGSYTTTPFARGMTPLPDEAAVIWDGAVRTVAGVEHELALPFEAPVFGLPVSRVLVGSDGALRFPHPDGELEVALFAGDLLVTQQGWTDRVRWTVTGQAPARRLIVEFASLSGRDAPRSYFSGQVHLREDGLLELHYDRGQRWDDLPVRVGPSRDGLGVGPSGTWREPPSANYRFAPSAAPDLAVADLRLTRDGSGWAAQLSVVNLGARPAPATACALEASRDGAVERLARATLPALDPGARHTQTLALSTPAQLDPGLYDVALRLETTDDADAANDRRADPAGWVAGDGVDLAVHRVDVRETSARAGGRVRVQVHLGDRGSLAAPATTLALVISANAELSAADRIVERVPLPGGLAAAHLETLELTLPDDLPAGLHWVGAVVDPDHALTQLSDRNDAALSARPLRVRADAAPDLLAEVCELETPAVDAGGQIQVRRAFRNRGDGAAGAFDYALYLLAEGAAQGRRLEVYRSPVAGLAAAAAYRERSVPLQVPAGLPAGRYALWLVIDPDDAVPELREDDNARRADGWLEVRSSGSPELAAVAVEPVFRTALVGGELRLRRTLQNRGSGPSGGFGYAVYLSTDPQVSTADRLLARFRLDDGLAAGEADRDRELTLTLPAGVAVGEHWLGLVVDPDGEVLDRDDDDVAAATHFVRVDRGGEVRRIAGWRAWVADGDTIEVDGESFRFLGADTPEKASRHFDADQEPYASRASAFTRAQLRGADEVALHLTGRDGLYGRDLVHIFVDGVSLSLLLVEHEHAYESVTAFGSSGFYELSRAIRDEARRHSLPFEEPLRWRARHRVD